ncbi:hypothetical protein niasHT_008452 [Heterodera trifolii]
MERALDRSDFVCWTPNSFGYESSGDLLGFSATGNPPVVHFSADCKGIGHELCDQMRVADFDRALDGSSELEAMTHIRSLKESGAPTLKSQKAAIRLIRLVSAVVSANGDYSNTNGKAIDGSKLLPFPMKRTHSYPESYDGIIHLTGCSVEIELTQNENTNNALSGLDTHGHCLQFRRSVERSVKIGYSHLVTQFMPNALTVGT